jgi:TatD DNase family protein
MSVASHQYQRNSPAYLPEVLDTLARLRELSADVVAAATTANARRVLRL